jgi:ketosteroid isomerase-like protein
MIIITTVDHHVKQRRRERGSVNEQGTSNEQQIRRANDVLHLQAMKATYCEIVDACMQDSGKAAARLAELFTEDVHADYGMGPLNGRNAAIEFLVGTIVATNDSLWHSIHTPRIDVSGDTATGHWTLMVRMKHKKSTTFDTLYGRYLDEFRRTQQGWRISSVRFIQEG